MILINCHPIYYNTQVFFKKNIIDNLPNDDNIWALEYRRWLKRQGATIVSGTHNGINNCLGVYPLVDKFCFENDNDALIFVLKWSQ